MNIYDSIRQKLHDRQQHLQLRHLRQVSSRQGMTLGVDGGNLINFSSNDYLGLSLHPELIQRGNEFSRKFGAGSTASRLVCGNFAFMEEVEQKLASLKGYDSALIFNSGYQANVSFIPALAGRKSLILADRLCHNSLLQGALLAGCALKRFRHNDYEHLAALLADEKGNDLQKFILSESVFSMDGDCADLDRLISLARAHDAFLIIDEAHATGVLGPQGMGLTCGKDVDLVIGTFGKALGAFGAYVCCSGEVRDYLINYCSGFIYSTALPPSVFGAIDAALDLVPQMESERQRLQTAALGLRAQIQALGMDTGKSETQIIPVLVGDEAKVLHLAAFMEENGLLAVAIRPPTVEKNAARIRLALSSLHDDEQLAHLVLTLNRWRDLHGG